MTTYKVDLTLNYETFATDKNDYSLWGELVCLTELSNGYLVLGFGRAMDLTNMIIDIKDNKPKLIDKFEIKNGDYCCRRIMTFNINEKEYFIAGDYSPQIFKANKPFNEIATLDISLSEMIQIKDSNLLAYINNNKFSILDLSNIEKDKQGKEIKTITFNKGNYNKLLQYKNEMIILDKNLLQFINLNNYDNKCIELNKEFYSLNDFRAMCVLFNGQLLVWRSDGELIKIDLEKKEIIQKIDIEAKANYYYVQCLAYKDKYLLFADEEKLYEINYNEKEEINNYEEKEPKYSLETFKKEEDNIVKKIIEEKDLKEQGEGFCRPPYVFYDIYRYKSLQKEFPMYNKNQIFVLSMKEYNNLKEENQKFFIDLSSNDKNPSK
jgi:hypothetical protein